MDIQNILNLAIQVIVLGFVSLMVFDFVNGLWVVPIPPAGWQPPVIEPATVFAVVIQPTSQPEISQSTPESPQFEEIPDPWSLEPAPVNTLLTSSVILSFPKLRLLPPSQEIQATKAKAKRRTNKPTKSTQPKSRIKAKAV